MSGETPRLKDLATVLVQPRATMRRILDVPNRWTLEVIVLACVCSSVADRDIGQMNSLFEDLQPGSSLALLALGLILSVIVGGLLWVGAVYLFGWMVTLAGRRIGGVGVAADVRAALAWSLAPLIWAVLVRVPIALYVGRFKVAGADGREVLLEFVRQGGCTLAVAVMAFQLAVFIWMVFIASSCVGEALQLSTGEGLGAIAMALAAPVVVGIAAALAFHT